MCFLPYHHGILVNDSGSLSACVSLSRCWHIFCWWQKPTKPVSSSVHAGAIASLSLAGPAVMEFRRTGESHALLLPPRSLLVMAGPARYCWQHYIPHRKADQVQGTLLLRAPRRMSFTFRQVSSPHCSEVVRDALQVPHARHTWRRCCLLRVCVLR